MRHRVILRATHSLIRPMSTEVYCFSTLFVSRIQFKVKIFWQMLVEWSKKNAKWADVGLCHKSVQPSFHFHFYDRTLSSQIGLKPVNGKHSLFVVVF